MIGGNFAMKLFRSVFREQKTRLTVDWLTHTDELVMEYLASEDATTAEEIAGEIDRSVEYISDRCRQLALRGLLEAVERGSEATPAYRLADLGQQYLAGEVSAEELEDLDAS